MHTLRGLAGLRTTTAGDRFSPAFGSMPRLSQLASGFSYSELSEVTLLHVNSERVELPIVPLPPWLDRSACDVARSSTLSVTFDYFLLVARTASWPPAR